jgi:hypothetical protein
MTTGEKLVELSSLTTGTALDHLLSIEQTGGGTTYVIREPLFGRLQKISLIGGELQKISLIEGEIQAFRVEGAVQKLGVLEGTLGKKKKIKGDLK